uniref:MARVEL domain-containing protein n=1 Tax=Romanomermis culicivorax TaxID=13658 RepID=A0A915L9I6_ROMCU
MDVQKFSLITANHYAVFYDYQPRYMNCCGKVHIWTLTKILCAMELLSTVGLIFMLSFSTWDNLLHAVLTAKEYLFLWCLISAVFSSLFFLGFRLRYKNLMIPKLVAEFTDCFVESCLAFYACLIVNENKIDNLFLIVVILVVSLIRLITQCYFCLVLIFAFRFVHDYNIYRLYC